MSSDSHDDYLKSTLYLSTIVASGVISWKVSKYLDAQTQATKQAEVQFVKTELAKQRAEEEKARKYEAQCKKNEEEVKMMETKRNGETLKSGLLIAGAVGGLVYKGIQWYMN